MHISWARLASFCYLGFISDSLIVSNFHNETHDPKGQENKLPQTVGLPRDPHAHLFDYYTLLSCIPIFDGKHIIISIRVPLVEYSQQFGIYRAQDKG